MTREQARREIDSLDFYLRNHTDDYGEESHTAMMMAIEALEQQDKVLDAIKEISDLLKQPAAFVPNYDAYRLCLSIIRKHMEVEE